MIRFRKSTDLPILGVSPMRRLPRLVKRAMEQLHLIDWVILEIFRRDIRIRNLSMAVGS
jgi:hypothetical protein